MIFVHIFAWILSIIFPLFKSHSDAPKVCSTHNQIEYCFYQGKKSPERLLVFLHGFGGNVESWSWYTVAKRLQEYWEKDSQSRPNILSISKGHSWWYTKKEEGQKINELIAHIKKEYQLVIRKQYLYGDSMGGHNAYRYFLDFPKHFDRLALSCPAVPRGFYQSNISQRGLWPINSSAKYLLRYLYQDSEIPMKKVLPKIAELPGEELKTKIYIITTDQDQYGFDQGDAHLYQMFLAAGFQANFELQSTNHCFVDPKKLATFLL